MTCASHSAFCALLGQVLENSGPVRCGGNKAVVETMKWRRVSIARNPGQSISGLRSFGPITHLRDQGLQLLLFDETRNERIADHEGRSAVEPKSLAKAH